MPMTLKPVSRRRFLTTSLAASAGLLGGASLSVAENPTHRFALLADTHIDQDPDTVVRGTNMFSNLRKVVDELLNLDPQPEGVLIDGDCAYLTGRASDYSTLFEVLTPLLHGGPPLHLALGNHDHRHRFLQGLPPGIEPHEVVQNKYLSVVSSHYANWFILDSLEETNVTPGTLGKNQIDWLSNQLDTHADKPALIMLHHNPDKREKPSGLTDTIALTEILNPRKQVKAVFFGHTHSWDVRKEQGIHWVNLPPVAYVFSEGKPNGWVDLRVEDRGATLELRCIDPNHPQHGEKVELEWRV